MSPEEARESLTTIVVQTAALLDLEGWVDNGAPFAESCESGNGVKWSYFYGAPVVDADVKAMTDTVTDHWRSLDMDVRTVTDPVPSVFATGGPLQGLAFTTGPSNYTISGTSLCAPGNADDYR